MKQIYLLLFASLIFSSPTFAQTFDCFTADSQKSKKNQLPDKDKAQIVKSVLTDFDFLNRHLYKDDKKEIVYLSTKNISSKDIPKILGINFVLLNEQEIEEKIKNGFGYFVFQKLKTDKVKTSVCFEYNYQDESYRHLYPNSSGSPDTITGILYEFRKINDKWKGKAIDGYQSQS